jgi:hypothetical protein
MAEAAYATGPALLGAPRLLSSIFFRIFLFMFYCETQTVRQCGALKSPSPPENARAPKSKKRGPIKLGPNVFLFPVSVFRRRAPKSPRSSENVRPLNLKTEIPNGSPKTVFLFPVSAHSLLWIQTARGPKESKAPKSEAPK